MSTLVWLDCFQGPFKHQLTLIPAWMSNHMPSKVWDEITYPFLNFIPHLTTVVTAPGTMLTAQSLLREVTAQSRLGHSSVTARSQLNHGPHHGSVTTGCDHFGHRELTVSSHGGHFFFSWETILVKGSPGNMVGVWIFCHISILKRCRLLKSLLIIIVE